MNYWWMIVAILGLVEAKPSTTPKDANALMKIFTEASRVKGRNSALENLIINTLEGLRQTMIHGAGTVPVLDPFEADRVFVDDSIVPIPGARLELQDIVVSHLSTFNVKRVAVTSTSILLQRYSVIIDVDVPDIDVKAGYYDLFGSVDGITLFGSGTAHVNIIKPELGVDALVGMRLVGLFQIYLNIIDLNIKIAFENIKINLTGMFNDTTLDGFVNLFLENLVMQLQVYYADDVNNAISPIIHDLANDILSDINLFDLLN